MTKTWGREKGEGKERGPERKIYKNKKGEGGGKKEGCSPNSNLTASSHFFSYSESGRKEGEMTGRRTQKGRRGPPAIIL